jgi:hypothetical protein
MTFLVAAQNAAVQLIGKKPATFFSSTGQFELEICTLANEIVADLVTDKDWRKLTVLKQMVGDGSTVGFDIPEDYDHMPKGMQVHNAQFLTWNYLSAGNLNEWLNYVNGNPLPSPGAWIILDGQMQFNPPVASGTTAQYYYISNQIINDGLGGTRSTFSDDNQTLVYPERLLTLGLIWRWRAMKRLEYAEDLRNFEKYKDQVAGDDKGSNVVVVGGRRRWPQDIWPAYPWALG